MRRRLTVRLDKLRQICARLVPTATVLAAIFFCGASPVNACIVRNMTYQEALAETDNTVLGEIAEILPSREGQLSRSLNFKVRVIQSDRGSIKAGTLIDVELLLDLARKVHGSIMCPLQRGSGMEYEFKVGGRYRMLVKADTDAFELFWGGSPEMSHMDADTT